MLNKKLVHSVTLLGSELDDRMLQERETADWRAYLRDIPKDKRDNMDREINKMSPGVYEVLWYVE